MGVLRFIDKSLGIVETLNFVKPISDICGMRKVVFSGSYNQCMDYASAIRKKGNRADVELSGFIWTVLV